MCSSRVGMGVTLAHGRPGATQQHTRKRGGVVASSTYLPQIPNRLFAVWHQARLLRSVRCRQTRCRRCCCRRRSWRSSSRHCRRCTGCPWSCADRRHPAGPVAARTLPSGHGWGGPGRRPRPPCLRCAAEGPPAYCEGMGEYADAITRGESGAGARLVLVTRAR